ncbi:MAG: hypothetical protein ACREMY_30930, partial [bacterium]
LQALSRVREYLRVWWTRPGPADPLGVVVGAQDIPPGDRSVVSLAESEIQSSLATLLAAAEWEELRRLPKGVQEARLAASGKCHTPEFLELLFNNLKQPVAWREAETVARLASLAVKGLDAKDWAKDEPDQLMARIWIELANSRRLAAEWEASDAALQHAKAHLGNDRLLQARWLSVSASLQGDKGNRTAALETLTRCRQLYELENDWSQVARTLVQTGYVLSDIDPLHGLKVLDQAVPLMPSCDPILRWLLEVTRTECFIETGQSFQALSAFRAAAVLRRFQPRPRSDIRSKFTSGRLLELLGYRGEAERLFEEVVSADLENSLLKDGFLDLLYLFAFYVKGGEPD